MQMVRLIFRISTWLSDFQSLWKLIEIRIPTRTLLYYQSIVPGVIDEVQIMSTPSPSAYVITIIFISLIDLSLPAYIM